MLDKIEILVITRFITHCGIITTKLNEVIKMRKNIIRLEAVVKA